MNSTSEEREKEFRQQIIRITSLAGWGSLALSTLFLVLTVWLTPEESSPSGDWGPAILMMISRTFGIGAFLLGAALLLLGRWNSGTLLFIFSIVLPVISFRFLGTI